MVKNIYRKTLIISLVVVWFSVFVKYDTIAFLSRNNEKNSNSDSNTNKNTNNKADSSGGSRIRDTIKEKFSHKDSDNEKSRVRQAISDKIHRVSDKFRNSDSDEIKWKKPASPYSPYKPNHHQQQQVPSPSPASNNFNNYFYQPSPPSNDHQPGPQLPNYQQPSYIAPQQISIDKSSKSSIMKSVAKKIFQSKMRHGSSGYKHNYESGIYNDYNYRPDKYTNIRGSTCTNYLEYDSIVYGSFICPIEGFEYDATYCCGRPREQYCCTLHEFNSNNFNQRPFNNNYNNEYEDRTDLTFLLILIPTFFILMILLGVCLFCVYRKRPYIYSLINRVKGNNDEDQKVDDEKNQNENENNENNEQNKLNQISSDKE